MKPSVILKMLDYDMSKMNPLWRRRLERREVSQLSELQKGVTTKLPKKYNTIHQRSRSYENKQGVLH